MEALIDQIPVPSLMGWCGLLTGIAFGYVSRALRFCTLSAVEAALYGENWIQARMWALAIGVATVGVHLLHAASIVDLTQTFHLLPRVAWIGPVVGGLLFGLGMSAVGTCAFGALLRAAGGDMRAMVVVLVVGASGYMTMRGLVGVIRVPTIDALTIPLDPGRDSSLAGIVGWVGGIDTETLRLPFAFLLGAGILWWCLRDAAFRRSRGGIGGGLGVGLLIVVGWFSTGYLGADPFDPQPIISLRFVAPTSEALVYLMTFTGATIDFGIASVFGVLVGAFLAAWRRREQRLEAFDDPREMRRHLCGGILMGVGGIVAMGCTVGQGLTGVSTMALPSFAALGSIVLGASIGLKLLMRDSPFTPFAALWRRATRLKLF